MNNLIAILNFTLIGIRVSDWLVALAALAVTYLLFQIAKRVSLHRIQRFSEKNTSAWNLFAFTEVSRIRSYFILALSIYLASLTLPLQPGPRELIKLIMEAALLLQIAVWGTVLINFLINDRVKDQVNVDPSTATTMSALSLIARAALWSIILLILLENIPGIQVTSLIASLGITGVAVALAVQRILGDLFASLSIALDKPFVLGDTITVDQFQGSVESIGLKSTRLRSYEGEQLIFSNSDLLNSRIHNYKRMAARRVKFTLRFSPRTTVDQLAEAPKLIKATIETVDGVTFERAHFKEISNTAFLFEVVYTVDSPSYEIYMDKQQAINLRLLQRFQEASINLDIPA